MTEFRIFNDDLSRRRFLKASAGVGLGGSLAGFVAGRCFGQSLSFEDQPIQHWRVGMSLTTPVTCTNVLATFPIPTNWPEQVVTLRNQSVPPQVSGWKVEDLPGGTKQIRVEMARVTSG